jgi:hypothetical protein
MDSMVHTVAALRGKAPGLELNPLAATSSASRVASAPPSLCPQIVTDVVALTRCGKGQSGQSAP